MNKIFIIIRREYLSRVQKKSFLILTLLMPVLMAAIMVLPAYLASKETKEEYKVAVVDHSKLFLGRLAESPSTKFEYISEEDAPNAKAKLEKGKYYALLDIPAEILTINQVNLFSKKQVSIDVKEHVNKQLESILQKDKRTQILEAIGIPDLDEKLKSTRTNITVNTMKIDESGKGKKGSTELAMGIGYAAGFIIYMFVFIYGSMVMRGVIEEKQNRIVEVIISSVKPIQLLMGKVIGLALVGLTQFAIWVLLSIAILSGVKAYFLPNVDMNKMASQNIMMPGSGQMNDAFQTSVSNDKMQEVFTMIDGINFTEILVCFFIFFILGYLLYSSLMAAVASAVDSEEDMQQFMLPITLPLIAAMVMLVNVIKNPEGQLAVWGSYIPFTSPIIMMVRVPFGVSWWEILLSMFILALSTFGCIWMAAKIYRTGILMYGKKPTWRELGKWLSYKN